jgi:hypothetical protein
MEELGPGSRFGGGMDLLQLFVALMLLGGNGASRLKSCGLEVFEWLV